MIENIRNALIDRQIRKRAAIHKTPLDTYRIRIARQVSEYEDAFHLLHIAFVYQGIENVRCQKMRITPQHVLPEATVFLAYEGSRCVGTMTVTLDSPAGLPVENDYPEETRAARLQGAKFVEYGSLAVIQRCWNTGVTVLLNTAATYWSINMLRATDIVMGINPKAASVYRAMYNFKPLGAPKPHTKLTAPVLGMRSNIPEVVVFGHKHFPTPLSSGLTIADHWTHTLPDCIEIPAQVPEAELTRWKLPRAVFQELFIERSDRLESLDPITLDYLKKYRSDQTLEKRD